MSRARVTFELDGCPDEDLQLGDYKKESQQTIANKPKTCVRCGFSGKVSDFNDYGKCPKCKEAGDYKDMPCPSCGGKGWLSKSGWICPRCPDPMGENAQGALYHRCNDGVVRIIPEIVNHFDCSVCKNPTWVNVLDVRPNPGPTTSVKPQTTEWFKKLQK